MTAVQEEVRLIVRAEHSDPFHILGMHSAEVEGRRAVVVRAFLPEARQAWVVEAESGATQPLTRLHPEGFFECAFPDRQEFFPYRLRVENHQGHVWEFEDPYRFPPVLSEFDLYLIGEGTHYKKYEKLGAHVMTLAAVEGVHYAVWAPNARRVSVIGNFNHWDGRRHPMRHRGPSGVWELFIPGQAEGELYKFEIRTRAGDRILHKTDPYAFYCEQRPKTAAIVCDIGKYRWQDEAWLQARNQRNVLDAPISIYEVHLGSWRRVPEEGNRALSYRELAAQLVLYAKHMGFTHLELLPVMEHPLDESWGYQTLGYFAPTSRYGAPEDFMYFVDTCHQAGLGVLLDWAPAHFPHDPHGLRCFDGTYLYEHADPRKGYHPDWGTAIFNYGRNEVRNFLLSNALFWLEKYHADGLRVDAVASMLYLDYSRRPGEWLPNPYGGKENLEAIEFLKHFNERVHGDYPGVLTIAEESTAWPMVSRPTYLGGLGFSLKWNLGWMHDSLRYISRDPIYRAYQHGALTFPLLYAFTENFVLPLSHDEVVHRKRALLAKMPGDNWQKFANLRTLFSYQWTQPGKKLLFMGGEFGQWNEWNYRSSLDWHLLQWEPHAGLQRYVRDLNRLYRAQPALHQVDFEPAGFEWLDFADASASVISYLRRARDPSDFVVVVLNFTPVVRTNYRIGVPAPGYYRELLNSDAAVYGGSNVGNAGGVWAEAVPWHGRPFSLNLTLPPLAVLILKCVRDAAAAGGATKP